MDRATTARRAIPLVDLTSLGDDDTTEVVDALCARAIDAGVAAVCIHLPFVGRAATALAGTGVAVATVVNFPGGGDDVASAVADARRAIADGADEVDLVVPYHRALGGDLDAVTTMVSAVDEAIGDHLLKAILETGALGDPDLVTAVASAAISGGADFVKTSTGKIPAGATPTAAAAMLTAIAQADRPIGIKVSGGVRTTEQAAEYLALIDAAMGADQVSAASVRFGASSLLDDLVEAGGEHAGTPSGSASTDSVTTSSDRPSDAWRSLLDAVPAVNGRAHIEEALRTYVDSWATGDVEGRLALFADDIVTEDPAGRPQANGKGELAALLRGGLPADWRLEFDFDRAVVVGDEAILTYRVTVTNAAGATSALLVDAHAVFGADGRIHRYRTFFDRASITDH